MRPVKLSMGAAPRGARTVGPARSHGAGPRLARHAISGLVLATLAIAVAGGFTAVRIVSDNTDATGADGRVPTSFGALWVDSFAEVATPTMVHNGQFGMPQAGAPDKVALEVVVRLANTTTAPVELTPARFALRLEPGGEPISVEGAGFESVKLLPGAVFDARMQFPVKGGEHRVSLLFDDLDGSDPIAIDLGSARFQDAVGDGHDHER